MITLPVAVAKFLRIEGSESLKVFIDIENREIVYKLEG